MISDDIIINAVGFLDLDDLFYPEQPHGFAVVLDLNQVVGIQVLRLGIVCRQADRTGRDRIQRLGIFDFVGVLQIRQGVDFLVFSVDLLNAYGRVHAVISFLAIENRPQMRAVRYSLGQYG